MLKGKYIGLIPQLRGKTALLRADRYAFLHKNNSIFIEAQFDDLDLELHGVNLAHNWRTFEKEDFEIMEGEDVEG